MEKFIIQVWYIRNRYNYGAADALGIQMLNDIMVVALDLDNRKVY